MVYQVVFLFPKSEVKYASRNSGGARRNCLCSRGNAAAEMFVSVRGSGSWLASSAKRSGSWEPLPSPNPCLVGARSWELQPLSNAMPCGSPSLSDALWELGAPASLRCLVDLLTPGSRMSPLVHMFLTPVVPHWPF